MAWAGTARQAKKCHQGWSTPESCVVASQHPGIQHSTCWEKSVLDINMTDEKWQRRRYSARSLRIWNHLHDQQQQTHTLGTTDLRPPPRSRQWKRAEVIELITVDAGPEATSPASGPVPSPPHWVLRKGCSPITTDQLALALSLETRHPQGLSSYPTVGFFNFF